MPPLWPNSPGERLQIMQFVKYLYTSVEKGGMFDFGLYEYAKGINVKLSGNVKGDVELKQRTLYGSEPPIFPIVCCC